MSCLVSATRILLHRWLKNASPFAELSKVEAKIVLNERLGLTSNGTLNQNLESSFRSLEFECILLRI